MFQKADSPRELQQIHGLNHRVFAEEIAQHARQSSGLLIDRFHDRNHYFIALDDGVVIGMISAHAGPDFSVTRRLPDPKILESFPRPIEIRLLAIESRARNRTVLAGLLWQVYAFAKSGGHSHLLISGISERKMMYCKLGFVPLGPAIPEGAASFIPMAMPINGKRRSGVSRPEMYQRRWNRSAAGKQQISLMPGPVCIHPRVAQSFASPPVSHRSAAFLDCFEDVREHLKRLAPGLDVALFPGGGTLANDAVAANLKALFGSAEGLILSNGEFGERLAGQGLRAGLRFRHLRLGWGSAWPLDAMRDEMNQKRAWIWAVHLETSTGVLNDVETLLAMAARTGSAVALDCVSSLGAVPIPSRAGPLYLASGVSGKSLGSYAGLAVVYLADECGRLLADKILCPSFDLLNMQRTRGPVSTVPSSLLFALARALQEHYGTEESIQRRFEDYAFLGQYVRGEMRTAGLQPFVLDAIAAPNITTFTLPTPSFPDKCLKAGYEIAHESAYLRERGWGQIATMGDVTPFSLDSLFRALRA